MQKNHSFVFDDKTGYYLERRCRPPASLPVSPPRRPASLPVSPPAKDDSVIYATVDDEGSIPEDLPPPPPVRKSAFPDGSDSSSWNPYKRTTFPVNNKQGKKRQPKTRWLLCILIAALAAVCIVAITVPIAIHLHYTANSEKGPEEFNGKNPAGTLSNNTITSTPSTSTTPTTTESSRDTRESLPDTPESLPDTPESSPTTTESTTSVTTESTTPDTTESTTPTTPESTTPATPESTTPATPESTTPTTPESTTPTTTESTTPTTQKSTTSDSTESTTSDTTESTTSSSSTTSATPASSENCPSRNRCHSCTCSNSRCPENGDIPTSVENEIHQEYEDCDGACFTEVRGFDNNKTHRGCAPTSKWKNIAPDLGPGCYNIDENRVCFCCGRYCNRNDMTAYTASTSCL